MELKTLQYLREKHGNKSNFVLYTADNILYFYTNKDFIIWDDENMVLHCVRANTAGAPEYVNGQSPVVIKSLSYDEIQYVSSGYDCDVFKDEIIDSFFGNLLSDKQKEILKQYVENISSLKDIEYSDKKYGLDVKAAESTVGKDIFNSPKTEPTL